MKAEHLMIGNYVKPTGIDFGDRHREINQIHLLQNNQYIVYFKSYPVGCYLDKLEPIPLDEKWLVKFGFEKEYIEFDEGEINVAIIYYIDKGNYRFEIHYCLENGNPVYDVSYNVPESEKEMFIRTISSVHELQNMYLNCEGTPLTIKTESK